MCDSPPQTIFLLGNVAYGVSLVEYGTSDMLTIRASALTGCTLTVAYFVKQPVVPWVAVAWNVVFCGILAVLRCNQPRSVLSDLFGCIIMVIVPVLGV
jgi:hypothetical protein